MGGGEYVAGLVGGAINFGASGTKTTMAMSGNTVKITFGTQGAEGILVGPSTTGSATTMVWSPVAIPYDRAAKRDVDRDGHRVRRRPEKLLMRRLVPALVLIGLAALAAAALAQVEDAPVAKVVS